MTKIKIVTDSSVTIEPEVAKELDITIVPLSVMVDGVVYSDADLAEGEFLRLMQSSRNLPKTSQPPVGVFADVLSNWQRMEHRLSLFTCLTPCQGLSKPPVKERLWLMLM